MFGGPSTLKDKGPSFSRGQALDKNKIFEEQKQTYRYGDQQVNNSP